jgi:protoheme IX farnesyltransferase
VIRRLSLAASVATLVLLVAGATVSATGAGLACPDWPLCHGRVIPPLEPLVLIEYGHRLLASVVGVLILALAFCVWRNPVARGRYGRIVTALVVLLALQVGLGGATVLSRLGPAIVGTHLTTAMAFLVLLVMLTARAQWEEPDVSVVGPPPEGAYRLAHLALGTAFVQVIIGGFVSAFGAGPACPDLPLCQGRLIPPDGASLLHVTHRVIGVFVVVLVGAAGARVRARADPAGRALAGAATAIVAAQAALGIANVLTHLHPAVRVAHLGGAALLLATLMALVVRLRAARPTVVRAGGAGGVVRDYVALTKPRIIVLLLITTITTMVVAAGGFHFGAALAALTVMGGALAAGAANAINCYWDRDIDALMRRTRGRPLPAGRVEPVRALRFGLALAALAVLILGIGVNWLAAALAAAGILFYIFVYTVWLKRNTPQNIVIGGAAGAIPPLVGWAAVTHQVGIPALVLFAIIFLWTPPHFWALALNREEDYRAAGIPMLPIVRGTAETLRQMVWYTIALVAATLALAGLGVLGRIYLVSAIVLALPFIGLVVRLVRQATPRTAWAVFEYSILYLGLLFAAMALDRLIG